MDPQSVSGATASMMWAYQRWNSADPNVTVTGSVASSDALAASPPSLLHRVDTWHPGSVASDWTWWSLRSAWSAGTAAASGTPASTALTEPAQQFIVSSGSAQLAALSPDAVQSSVVNAVSGLLGASTGDITAALTAGGSLSSQADANGTTHDELITAISSALPDLGDPILQDAAAEQIAATPGLFDASTLQVPASAGSDETQVLALSLNATSDLLSIDPPDLMQLLSQGTSLSSLADSAGVAHSDLIAAVASDLPPQTPGWTDPTALAEQIAGDATSTTEVPAAQPTVPAPAPAVDPSGGQQFTVDPGAGPQPITISLGATASLLSTMPADLMQQLSQGASLYSIADGLGVAHGDVITAVESDLPAQTPGWTDLDALADQVASGTDSSTVAPTPTTGQQFTVDPGTGPQTMTLSLTATAGALSSTPGYVMQQLSQGLSLYSIADGLGLDHGDLITALESDLPAQTPGWPDLDALADQVASVTDSTSTAPPPTQQFTVDPGTGPQTLSLSLAATSSLLSSTPGDLMQQLSQGTSLYAIADSQGVDHGDLLAALESDLPAQTPGWTDLGVLADQLASATDSTTGDATQAPAQFTVDPGTGPQTMNLSLDATAALLSSTPNELIQQLSQGASLYSIADSQGVAHSDLIGALETDLPAQTPGWTDLGALTDQIASAVDFTAVPPASGQQFSVDPGTGPQPITVSLAATAALLASTPSDLMQQLSQGASLYSIADGQGVARSDLLTALESDLPAQTPGWSDLDALADQVASDTISSTIAPSGPTPPVPTATEDFTVDPGTGPQTIALSLAATAGLLSTTPDDLMQQLSNGTSLYAIADSLGVAHSDLLTAIQADLPAQTPGWNDLGVLADQLAANTTSTTSTTGS